MGNEQTPQNPVELVKQIEEIKETQKSSELSSEKYKPIKFIFFIIQLIIFLGLIFVSFKSTEIISAFASNIESLLIFMIIMVIVSIAGAITVLTLEIYIFYKKILNKFIKNFFVQIIISIVTGQIVSFAISTIFVDKAGIKMSKVQTLTFIILLLIWIGLAVGMILSADINFDINSIVANFEELVKNQVSSVTVDNAGQIGEEVSGGQVNASFIDDLIKMGTDLFESVTGSLSKAEGLI
jgi:hypothetical protein